ncbi:hypothetical protein C8R45DRAFT_1181995 [Mycena sanguinolenta]|nr:hypothetical protein C8R45DRAFT_1181995 [Mycena sanguinolenta]
MRVQNAHAPRRKQVATPEIVPEVLNAHRIEALQVAGNGVLRDRRLGLLIEHVDCFVLCSSSKRLLLSGKCKREFSRRKAGAFGAGAASERSLNLRVTPNSYSLAQLGNKLHPTSEVQATGNTYTSMRGRLLCLNENILSSPTANTRRLCTIPRNFQRGFRAGDSIRTVFGAVVARAKFVETEASTSGKSTEEIGRTRASGTHGRFTSLKISQLQANTMSDATGNTSTRGGLLVVTLAKIAHYGRSLWGLEACEAWNLHTRRRTDLGDHPTNSGPISFHLPTHTRRLHDSAEFFNGDSAPGREFGQATEASASSESTEEIGRTRTRDPWTNSICTSLKIRYHFRVPIYFLGALNETSASRLLANPPKPHSSFPRICVNN